MESTARTRRVAQSVLDYIEAHPDLHRQDSWYRLKDGRYNEQPTEENICNTTMCVAGTAIYLQHGIKELIDPTLTPGGTWEDEGARLLGLNHLEEAALFLDSTDRQAVDLLEAVIRGDSALFEEISNDDSYYDED